MNILVMLIAAISLAAIAFFILKPARVLAIYAFTRPIIQPFILLNYKLVGIPYSYLWALILPAAYAVNFFGGRWKLICYKSTPLFVLLIIAVLSSVVSIDIGASVEGTIKLLSGFLAFGMAYNSVKNMKQANTIIMAVVLCSVVPMIFGYYQFAIGNYSQIHFAAVQRVNSVFGVGNAYGIFLSITICASLMLLLNPGADKKVRFLVLGLLASMVASQVLALNRGTWLALTCAILIALVPYRKKVKIRWFIAGGIIIAVVFSGVIVKRFSETTYRYDGEVKDTLAGRVETWQMLAPHIMERPILGHGPGTTEDSDEGGGDTRLAPHNDYVRLAMDVGLLGCAVYIYFLLSLPFFYLRKRAVLRGSLWRFNFAMGVLTTYFIVISATQNIVYNLTNFGLFLILNGVVIKLNVLEANATSVRILTQDPKSAA